MTGNIYESSHSLAQYLLFHYGTPEDVLPYPDGPRQALDYAVRCVSECLDPALLPAEASALDLGCAVGRSSFELARFCRRVTGIDFSRQFVEAAALMARQGCMEQPRFGEGQLSTPVRYRIPGDIDRTRVHF